MAGTPIDDPVTLEELFHLPEGPVTLSSPADISIESYQDLADQLGLFLRRVKRKASARAAEVANNASETRTNAMLERITRPPGGERG